MTTAGVLQHLHISCGEPLVRRPKLMMADHVVVAHLVPFRSTNVMMRANELVAHEAVPSHCIHEVVTRHLRPMPSVDLRIIDLTGGVHISLGLNMIECLQDEARY